MVADEGVLKIFLATKSGVELDETPMELVDEIFNFCGMLAHNPEHSEMCLHVAMSQSNSSRISKVFADKGIPSLESLEFADADEEDQEDKEDDEKRQLPPSYSEGESSKTKSRPFGDFSVAETVFAVPVGIAFGLGALFKSKRHFDGEVEEHDALRAPSGKSANTTSEAKNTKVRTSNMQPREGSNGLQNFHKSFSRGLLRLRIACSSTCDEDVAFKGEFAVSSTVSLSS